MMSEHSQRPFLSHFFEGRGPGGMDELGTSTVTKTAREGGDTDYASRHSVAGGSSLATKTLTEAREDADADEPPKKRVMSTAGLGTETRTATREQGDADRASPAEARSAILGTKTNTRARENGDVDTVSGNDSLWTASII